jgi:hypothetical protein
MSENHGFEQQAAAILKQDYSVAPSFGLLPRILLEIEQRRQSSLRKRMFVLVASSVGLAFLTFLTWSAARLQLAQSGMGQMLSLLFTDFKEVLVNWQSYTLLLLESLPVMSVFLALASATGLLILFKFFVQTARQTRVMTKLIYKW